MLDLEGKIFGKLKVLKFNGIKNNYSTWLCKCECGNVKVITGTSLVAGRTVSCGCNKNEKFLKTITKHNKSKTRLYRIWHAIKDRCYREKNISYKNYGARGIKVCDEWKNDFKTFYDWAMSNGYDEKAPRGKYTIDRIDVNGNYEPSNCRWSTQQTQNNNKRSSCKITYKGETHTITEWANILNLSRDNIDYRYKKGWDLDKVFSKEIFNGGKEKWKKI